MNAVVSMFKLMQQWNSISPFSVVVDVEQQKFQRLQVPQNVKYYQIRAVEGALLHNAVHSHNAMTCESAQLLGQAINQT